MASDIFDRFKVIDTDTHITEPHDVWTSRVASKWGDMIPHVKRLDGRDIWFHKASVAENGFEKLEKDTPVELSIVDDGPNGMGPQATSVRPIGRMRIEGEVPSRV